MAFAPIPPLREARVVHCDDALVVVDKPAGVSCHDAPGRVALTARVNAWLEAQGQGGDARLMTPIDGEASGLVLFGRTKDARRTLAEASERGIERRWIAGVGQGPPRWPPPGLLEEVIGRERISRGPDDRELLALASDERSQPVRRWLADVGAPIAGDADQEGPPAERLMLHLAAMRWPMAHAGPVALEAPIPERLQGWLEDEALPKTMEGWVERLTGCLERRYGIEGEAYRIAHGAGDGTPGFEIDRYGDFAVVALRDEAAERQCDAVVEALQSLGAEGVYLKRRPVQANTLVDSRRPEVAPGQASAGRDAPSPLVIHEDGLPYEVRLGDGLSTGIFLDQRDARAWVRRHAEGARVLNLFCYHAAFTVPAIAGGAKATVSVDVARPALDAAARNLALQGAGQDAHRLLRRDTQSYLQQATRDGIRFDLIVLDPPSYATSKRGRKKQVWRVARDLGPTAAQCLRLLAPGGHLLACTNHRGLSPKDIKKLLRKAARDAKRQIASLDALPSPLDHPPPPGEPCHLKRFVLTLA